MERFIQHDPLFIRHFTTEVWPFPVHNHNHFELVFIHSGSGLHQLNGKEIRYQGPCLFLLAPADYHLFVIEQETEFSVLKFNNRYLDGMASNVLLYEWNKLIDQLVVVGNAFGTELVQSPEELDRIHHLMRMIVREWEGSAGSSNEVLLYLIRSVFAIIKRNAFQIVSPDQMVTENRLVTIMNYIHTVIRAPELLSLKALSAHFNTTPSQLSSLFKRQMGISIKQYTDDYKFKLIENRLKFSDVLLKEISNDFGFTDLSHFNKFLKNHTGKNPKVFRKEV
ncbi:AraC family transcriptional regulator [Flavobacterium kingsejongi]|uniref:HTH araC/xylS-type domain-containing protein n=1 Tax=Flavobacterium kingsejongi TaxID=1678728 RepID=A0A2S1LNJ5_9FLAO|nr:AraC family transcriptional regulator [Flavobacterium kingsejongi]AWG25251.1 hypothetical protein FK004_08395 [Flavobacterium kingsejongi]